MNLKFSSILYFSVFLFLGGILFKVKYTVVDLEILHKSLRKAILEKSEGLHVLKAEWACLTSPNRLKALANKYLKLSPIQGDQIISYKDLQNSGLGEYDRERLDSIIKQGTNGKGSKNERP
jgi:hypothetical protein